MFPAQCLMVCDHLKRHLLDHYTSASHNTGFDTEFERVGQLASRCVRRLQYTHVWAKLAVALYALAARRRHHSPASIYARLSPRLRCRRRLAP